MAAWISYSILDSLVILFQPDNVKFHHLFLIYWNDRIVRKKNRFLFIDDLYTGRSKFLWCVTRKLTWFFKQKLEHWNYIYLEIQYFSNEHNYMYEVIFSLEIGRYKFESDRYRNSRMYDKTCNSGLNGKTGWRGNFRGCWKWKKVNVNDKRAVCRHFSPCRSCPCCWQQTKPNQQNKIVSIRCFYFIFSVCVGLHHSGSGILFFAVMSNCRWLSVE